jgi:hypothetical protein
MTETKKVISRGVGDQQDTNLKYFMDFSFSINNRETHECQIEKIPPQLAELYDNRTIKIDKALAHDIANWLEQGLPTELAPYIFRIKDLFNDYEASLKNQHPLFQSEENLAKMSKSDLISLGKEVSQVNNSKIEKDLD